MRSRISFTLSALMWAIALIVAYAVVVRAQTSTGKNQPSSRRTETVQQSAVDLSAVGTIGQIPKYIGVNAFADSVISEDKFGNVGIGTTLPQSKLTVKGMIETTMGGIKFPDGTVQTTAAVSGGGGGVTVPLLLNGDVGVPVLQVSNLSGIGAEFTGGLGGTTALVAQGGVNLANQGGTGIIASGGGGAGSGAVGGIGVLAQGGTSQFQTGGVGIFAFRGTRTDVNPAFDGLAGYFSGNVQITGTISKGGGSFKIDHPLDPENKYLYHSFIESPDMMNIYNGNITTDATGQAVVELPSYFEALNRDFRYQLSVIGTFAQAIIAEEISNNRFTIKTSEPRVKVSWQVTGIRQDVFANKHRIPVEELKNENERGHYLHPELFNKPEEKSIEWARYSEAMQRMRGQRQK
jgi:hypothetical protein